MISVPRPSRLRDRARARLAPPGIDPERVGEVLARLGRSPAGPPRNLGGGHRSRNVAVATDRGLVVVKRYRSAWDPDTVTYGHSIARRLEVLGLPGPRLVAAPDGSTVVAIQGATYAAFDLISGKGYASSYLRRRDRLALLRRAGRCLGEMHRGLEGFVPDGRHHMAFASLDGSRVRDHRWYAETVRGLRETALPGSEPLAGSADELVEAIEGLDVALTGSGLPRTVIHGDFGLHNVVFVGDRAVPIDLELARLDLRLTDHVLIVGRFLDASTDAPDVDGLEAILGGLSEAWPLTADERGALADAWRFQRYTSAVRAWWSATTSDDPGARIANARRALDGAGWLDAHPDVRDRLFGPASTGSRRG